MSTGAADVPAFLWYRHLQRPTLRRFEERVRQEPGKGRPAERCPPHPHPHPPTDAGADTVTGYLPAALIAARDHRAGLRGHLVRTRRPVHGPSL